MLGRAEGPGLAGFSILIEKTENAAQALVASLRLSRARSVSTLLRRDGIVIPTTKMLHALDTDAPADFQGVCFVDNEAQFTTKAGTGSTRA
jgi:hypothetical protein